MTSKSKGRSLEVTIFLDFMHFTNHVNTVDEENDPLTGHLFSLKGARWRSLRSKLTPVFTSGKIKMMFQTLANCSDDLVSVVDKHIEEVQPIDVKDVVARFTTDVIASCAFGIECNSLKNPNSEFRKYGRKIFEVDMWDSLTRLMTFFLPNLLIYIKIRTFRKDMTDFFVNTVKETVNYRDRNNIIRKDFMHLLIQLKNNVKITDNDIGDLNNKSKMTENIKNDDNKPLLTMNELAAQAFVFLAAGFETSSTAITFCLYELVQNPEFEDLVREEINMILVKYDGKLSYDARSVEHLKTLRKYPPVPIHTRECTKTYKVPGTNIILDKGSLVFIPVLGIQRDPKYYPDPDKFDPERFSEEQKATRHSATWTPFGDGPRACIGLRFGLMQTKFGLATLLKHFKFTLHPKTEIPIVLDLKSFFLAVEKGIWLKAERI
ncbi:hypothetical protein ILUMI_03246 [Ignelater luminosus]|uniref:Cytochrome P450 n=1 Tax=Ignelater luminosus TaxID=2038154 RepID=A0A8K0DGN5_IGNLU|nr:hypothetical protein ILUMI_03246 [Ignelater luminosus]